MYRHRHLNENLVRQLFFFHTPKNEYDAAVRDLSARSTNSSITTSGSAIFCSRSGLTRWTSDKMSRSKAKLMRKGFEQLEGAFRPWLGSCIRALALAWTRLLSWDGLASLPWPPSAWPPLAPAQNSCSSPLARALGGCTCVHLQLPKPCPCPTPWSAALRGLKSDYSIWEST